MSFFFFVLFSSRRLSRARKKEKKKTQTFPYRDQQLSSQQTLQRHKPPKGHHLSKRRAQISQSVRSISPAQRVDHEQRRGGGGAGEVVSERMIEPRGDVGGVEGAVGGVERDVAEGHHGVGEHDEDLLDSGKREGAKRKTT